MTRRILSAATLSGYQVRSRTGEDLGCIDELMVLPHTGQIVYAVLSPGGLPGLDGRLLAVPWGALELDQEQRVLVLDADRERLRSEPAFHEEHWPDFSDAAWAAEVEQHHSPQVRGEAA